MVVLKRGKVTKDVHSPYEIKSLKAQGFTEEGGETEAVVDAPKATKKDTKKAAIKNDTDATGSTNS